MADPIDKFLRVTEPTSGDNVNVKIDNTTPISVEQATPIEVDTTTPLNIMSLPVKNKDESTQEFVSRCMKELEGEFTDERQRAAVCFRQAKEPNSSMPSNGGKPS